MAISLYGNYILAGSADSNIYLYQKSSNNSMWSFDSGTEVKKVAMSLTGSYFSGISVDESNIHTIYLFQHDIPNPLRNINIAGDDDSETNNAISFGKYYLFFITIGITGLIIISKRKTIFRKK